MAVLGEEDDGWDPSWEEEDAPARQGARGGAAGEAEVQQPKSWEDFWDGACQANEQAMHDAAKGGAVQHEQKQLVDGLPANGDLRCSGCKASVAHRLECAHCLEVYNDRASVCGIDWWERALFCSAECFESSWSTHRGRHVATTYGPSRTDSRVHKFAAPRGHAALWDTVRLKRLELPSLQLK